MKRTTRTVYHVSDHDMIEALVALGIPCAVVLSPNTIIKVDEIARDEAGFYFNVEGRNGRTPIARTLLTVETEEAPSEEAPPMPVAVPVDPPTDSPAWTYPIGTVLRGMGTRKEYVVSRYDTAAAEYTLRDEWCTLGDERACVNSWRSVHSTGTFRPARYPIGTVLRFDGFEAEYTVTGYASASKEKPADVYLLTGPYGSRWDSFETVNDPARCCPVRRVALGRSGSGPE